MKCARCSAEIPKQSQFCLRCGTPVTATAFQTVMPSASMPLTAPKPNNRPLIAAIAMLTVLVLVLGGFVLKGLTQKPATGPAQAQLVQAPGNLETGKVVQAPSVQPPTPLVQVPADTAPPPTDVSDYLAFLKKIEASKQRLIRAQTGDALSMLAQAKALSGSIDEGNYNDTFGNLNKGMNYNADEWNQLTQAFQQRVPPDSCRDLHDKYYDQLGKIQAMIVSVNDAMSKVSTDPSAALHALSEMQGKASADADAAIMAADDALAEVCDKNHLRKDFDIRGDSGSSSLLR